MARAPVREPSRAVQSLRALWQRKRGDRAMPARRDFAIDDLAPWLGRLNLISLRGDVARFDVFGTDNSRDLGAELTGRTIDALPDEDRALTRASIERARAERAPVFETITMVQNQRVRLYDRLVLPLSDDGRVVDRVLVLIDSTNDGARLAGRWVATSSPRVHAPER